MIEEPLFSLLIVMSSVVSYKGFVLSTLYFFPRSINAWINVRVTRITIYKGESTVIV